MREAKRVRRGEGITCSVLAACNRYLHSGRFSKHNSLYFTTDNFFTHQVFLPKLIAAFICAVLTFSAASVRAEALSTSQARIDWESLAITGDITWEWKVSESLAYAEDVTGWDEDEDWYEDLEWVDTSAFASTLYAYGDAYTSDVNLYEEVYAIANEATTPWPHSWAFAQYIGGFRALSEGVVEFSVNYELSQELRTDCEGEWASGLAKAELYLANYSVFWADDDLAQLENVATNGESISVSDTGILTVSLLFGEDHYGEFSAGVENDAYVEIPEPATIALLGLGALGLLRRKRSV